VSPNQYTKSPRRTYVIPVRLTQDERNRAAAEAERRRVASLPGASIADVLRGGIPR
jgi:hypothetical protein